VPVQNLETAFWLESDRMLSLAFSEKSLGIQRKVVCEEFKEHYINKPYGDLWHKMRELAFSVHPYRWMTIGKELKHVEDAKIEDVKQFFKKHYCPANAILVVAGPMPALEVKALADKWFGPIASGEKYNRQLPIEPVQEVAHRLEIKANVPVDAFVKTWHMAGRLDDGYYIADLLTEILGGGGSSRLFQSLVKEQQLFSSIDCYHYGSIDPGLFTIEGKLVQGVDMAKAEAAVMEQIDIVRKELVSSQELQKVKNKTESVMAFEDMGISSRASSLAFYELLGDANLMNTELDKYYAVTEEDIRNYSKDLFAETNSNTIWYLSNKN
jgi:predicted Zn-dependent peptidase